MKRWWALFISFVSTWKQTNSLEEWIYLIEWTIVVKPCLSSHFFHIEIVTSRFKWILVILKEGLFWMEGYSQQFLLIFLPQWLISITSIFFYRTVFVYTIFNLLFLPLLLTWSIRPNGFSSFVLDSMCRRWCATLWYNIVLKVYFILSFIFVPVPPNQWLIPSAQP